MEEDEKRGHDYTMRRQNKLAFKFQQPSMAWDGILLFPDLPVLKRAWSACEDEPLRLTFQKIPKMNSEY